MTKFNDVYGNEVSLTISSHAAFRGTWLTITHRDNGKEGKEQYNCPPCALTPAQLKLLIAACAERLEQIEIEGE